MKRLFAMLLAAAHLSALACAPSDLGGTGTASVVEANSAGAAAAWWCPGLVEPTLTVYAVRWDALTPQLRLDLAQIATATNKTAAIERAAASVTTPLADLTDVWWPMRAALRASKPPASQWAVARNGAYTTRPAYTVTSGVRETTATGRADVGAACDCRAIGLIEGASTYCAVAPTQVALCARVP